MVACSHFKECNGCRSCNSNRIADVSARGESESTNLPDEDETPRGGCYVCRGLLNFKCARERSLEEKGLCYQRLCTNEMAYQCRGCFPCDPNGDNTEAGFQTVKRVADQLSPTDADVPANIPTENASGNSPDNLPNESSPNTLA